MNNAIVEILYVSREPAWAAWAVQYFFLIGLSVGCFLLSLPGIAFGRADWKQASRMALLGALVCAVTAPVALVSDLAQPGRFLNFYLHPHLTSWMSWGAFFIPAYIGLLLLYAWAALAPEFSVAARQGGVFAWPRRLLGGRPRPGLVRRLAYAALLAAALVALYTGVEVMAVKARPLWNTPLLPLQYLATAIAGAAGLTLLLERIVGRNERAVEVRLNHVLAGALAAVAAIAAIWLALALSGLSSSAAQGLQQVAPSPAWQARGMWLLLLVVLPLLLATAKPGGTGWATGPLTLAAAWMFRWTVFMDVQDVPKTGAGWYAHGVPLGPEGLLGIAGTAGLWLFVVIALTALLPWSGPESSARSTALKGA